MTTSIGSREAKDVMFDTFAKVTSALASGRRLEIIDVLSQAPRSVEAVAEAIDQSVANTSHHLRRLAEDGLIQSNRDGRHVIYELASDDVYQLWRAIQDVTATHQDGLGRRVEDYVGDRSEIETIDHDTMSRWLESGQNLVVIDVRPEAEYAAGHIEGAISVPPDQLDRKLAELPDEGDVVAYCRGRYCAFADQAVHRLRTSGRSAYRLEAGYRDWSESFER